LNQIFHYNQIKGKKKAKNGSQFNFNPPIIALAVTQNECILLCHTSIQGKKSHIKNAYC